MVEACQTDSECNGLFSTGGTDYAIGAFTAKKGLNSIVDFVSDSRTSSIDWLFVSESAQSSVLNHSTNGQASPQPMVMSGDEHRSTMR